MSVPEFPLVPEPTTPDLPKFASEMSEDALSSYLDPDIQPLPLPDGVPSVMSWDYDLLPDALRGFVRDVAERTQCPPDFVAVALVVALSAVVGRKFTIHPKQNDDWEVVANLWGCLIGRPSSMKSPALKQALRFLQSLEAAAREKHSEAMTEHKADSDILELQRKFAKDNARELLKEGKADAAKSSLTAYADDLTPPTPRRYIVNDTTVEKLGELLNQNPNGLLQLRDELSGWLAQMKDEDRAMDRAFYLECSEGNGQFTYDRIGRGTLHIESCCMSLVGGIQPSRIAPLVRGSISGESDDGLVQRLQLAVWPDDEHEWSLVDRRPEQAAWERVESVFKTLNELPNEPRKALRFTQEAQKLFNEWYTEHMQQLRGGKLHPSLQSHLLKMPKTIAGLALLIELIGGGRDAVGHLATARALDWADYLKSHAGRLYGTAINAPILGARLILDRRGRLPEPFTPREIRSKGWAGLDSTQAVNDALAILYEHLQVVRYEVADENGGRTSTKYVWRRSDHGPMAAQNSNSCGDQPLKTPET